jgi:broad specificity phosphatase PhoE
MTIRIMIFYIFRHGETFFTKNEVPYGDSYESAEILPEAIPVIEKIGNYIKNKIENDNYTSPFKRATQTVEIVEKITGKKFIPDERIKEEGLSRAWETIDQLEERLRNFISEMENKKAEKVAVCSHGWPIAAMISILTRNKLTKYDLSSFPKCGILIIIEDASLKTLDFN